jgi:beta-N-acetylhexosaminidase
MFEENAPMASRPSPLTESQQAGQILIVGIDGTSLDANLKSRLQRVAPAGIILFARNLLDASQVAAFCRDLYGSLPIPPFLAIDQEGGRVNRLKGIFPVIPPNLALASDSEPESRVRQHARQTGIGLRHLGFNLNFAPVLDLSGADDPNGIGDRAYGRDPEKVSSLARVFLTTQAQQGVLGCGKHFPGLGGGTVDSHVSLPVIPGDADRLWSEDLLPYRSLRDILPMVMVGHAYYPALQGSPPTPATLSEAVVRRLLRERTGFQGVILTDDLEMGAVDQEKRAGDVALEALRAGNDLVMYCKSWEKIEEAHFTLSRALQSGALSRERVEDSLARILALKEQLPAPGTLPSFDPGSFEAARTALANLDTAPA